jgi:hypothetical protein
MRDLMMTRPLRETEFYVNYILERGKTIENIKARLPCILVLEVESKAMYYVLSSRKQKKERRCIDRSRTNSYTIYKNIPSRDATANNRE